MIRKLKYHEIDFEKYTLCLENSEQRKYSATKNFLDISSDKKWELLVYTDYEAVMPVPFVRKMGLKFVINPKLCQQLGIYSEHDDVKINDAFLNFLEKKYNVWYYAFNEKNTFTKNLKQRKNFLIYPEDYETVRQRYSPKRKRKLRLDDEVVANSEIKEMSFEGAEEFISENFIGAKNENDKNSFLKIFFAFQNKKCLKIVAFLYQNKVINVLALYFDEKTIALLGTFNTKDSIKLSGSSVLIDYVIRENIEHKIFDFEGSEIPSVEEFFRGFRPDLKPYPIIKNSKKDLLKIVLQLR